jgi:replication-associated recombination protein RarA
LDHSHHLVDYFAHTDFVNPAASRYALRATLTSDFSCSGILHEESNLFELVGTSICWSDFDAVEIWTEVEAARGSGTLPTERDVASLLALFAQGHLPMLSACQEQALAAWRSDPVKLKQLFVESLKLLESAALAGVGAPCNLEAVRTLYALTPLEVKILEIAVLSNQRADFRKFLTHFPLPNTQDIWKTMAAMTASSQEEIRAVLQARSKLRKSGLIVVDYAPDHLEEFVRVGPMGYGLFQAHPACAEELRSGILAPASLPELSKEDFPHLAKEINWIAQSFKSASDTRKGAANILLRGSAGSGKTQLARILLQEASLTGYGIWTVYASKVQVMEPLARLERLDWTESLLESHASPAIIVENINELASESEALLVEAMERTTIPTVWIDDGSKPLSESVMRRFMYHLELRNPPMAARKAIAAKILGELTRDADAIEALASGPYTHPAQISMAGKFAEMSTAGTTVHPQEVFSEAIQASQRAAGKLVAPTAFARNGIHWDLESLNLEISAPLPRILAALQRTGCGSLAFHGIPGTGKTSLANHIASVLDRPLLAKRVSDLSSKWIGETEKCIAGMFQEAVSENAVLLLDEGDSFLRDRRLAKAPWEITQVNELLQQMESYKGIFICATNLMEEIDAAALRRFTFKVKFLPLDDVRRQKMFATCALADPNATIPREIDARLKALDQLAPGDFATIHRQEQLIDERFTVDGWITELEREHALRMHGTKRRAAFV